MKFPAKIKENWKTALRSLSCGLGNFCYLLWMETLDLIKCGFAAPVLRLKLLLWQAYRFSPPHRLIKQYSKTHLLPESDLIYGEPLVFTLRQMFETIKLKPEETLLDLGCGRGLGVLAAGLLFQAQALGVELIPEMVNRGKEIARALGISDRTVFWAGNFLELEIPQAQVIYLCWTTFSPPTRAALEAKISLLPAGTRIISLTHQLQGCRFKTRKTERLYFTWGKATIYYQEII